MPYLISFIKGCNDISLIFSMNENILIASSETSLPAKGSMASHPFQRRSLESASDPGTPSKSCYEKHYGTQQRDRYTFDVENFQETQNQIDTYFAKHDLCKNSTFSMDVSDTEHVENLSRSPDRRRLDLNFQSQRCSSQDGTNVQYHQQRTCSTYELGANLLYEPRKSFSKFRHVDIIEEHDLSSPYNHYRCLSPSDSNLSQTHNLKSCDQRLRFLKRQYSLDRSEEPCSTTTSDSLQIRAPLHKQNSAGAANDLEKIEELPLKSPKVNTIPKCAVSLSVDALALH